MKTKIIYILSSGHSGSTLLDLIIGSNSRIESVGEIKEFGRALFDEGESNKTICPCGATVATCPYWSLIRERIINRGVDQNNFLKDLSSARHDNKIFVEEVLQHSGKQIYAESTKSLDRLKTLEATKLFDIYVIHLVRDGRAVAYSNVKKGRNLYNFIRRWMTANFRMLQFRNTWRGRWITVHYERLVSEPAVELKRIMDFAGVPFEESQMDFARSINHNLFGNRMRRSASSEIVPDTKYLTQLGRLQWKIATVYALPVLRKLGYPLTLRGAEKLFNRQS